MQVEYFPDLDFAHLGLERHLALVEEAVALLSVPVIASLNCVTGEGWIDYAKQMQQAGASGLELNIYSVEADLDATSEEVEQRYLDELRAHAREAQMQILIEKQAAYAKVRSVSSMTQDLQSLERQLWAAMPPAVKAMLDFSANAGQRGS